MAAIDEALELVKRLARASTPTDGIEDEDEAEEIMSDYPGDDAYEDACAFFDTIREAREIVSRLEEKVDGQA